MKKTLLGFLLILVLASVETYGQAFDKDTQVFGAGIGIGSSLGNFTHSSQIPAISLQYEKGMWQAGNSGVISLGGYLGYKSFSNKFVQPNFESNSKWNYTIIGVRSAYHYQGLDNEKIDLYGGLMLGYNILNYSYSDNLGNTSTIGTSYGNTFGLSIYAGARYYFIEGVSAFAELGYGVSFLNLGVAFKL